MAGIDPNDVWLGHVQPVGLVVAPIVLARFGLVPAIQTRADMDAASAFISPKPDDDRAKPADRASAERPIGVLPWAPRLGRRQGRGRARKPCTAGRSHPHSRGERHRDRAKLGGRGLRGRFTDAGADRGVGVRPDERGALAGWEATPHQRFERLLRGKQVPIGVLITDEDLRLVYAPSGETSGWLTFPLRSLIEVGGREMLGGLKLLLSSFRLHNDAPERVLPALLKASREAQAEVSTRLAAQVLGACTSCCEGCTRPIATVSGRLRRARRSIFTTAC